MLSLHFDPFLAEVLLREQPLPEVIANFSEFVLTTNLQLNAGVVEVIGYVEIDPTGKLNIGINGTIEII